MRESHWENKLFRPPYLPASYLASLPKSCGHTPVFVCGDADVQSKRELLREKKASMSEHSQLGLWQMQHFLP